MKRLIAIFALLTCAAAAQTPQYLPLAGGTLKGPLFGTSATFSSTVIANLFSGPGTGLTGVAASLTAGKATNVAGGATGSVHYQSSVDTTAFVSSPTTAAHTFVLAWQPGGFPIAPAAVDLATYLASPPAIGGTAPAAGTFTAGVFSTSLQLAGGTAMTANQGNGVKMQHSTGAATSGNFASFDAGGNTVDSGIPVTSVPAFTGTSGFQAQGSGLVMAWASGTSVSADSVQGVTLPTTFTHACLAAWTVNLDPSETTNIGKNWAVVSCSTTTVTVELQRRGDEGSFSAQPKVFAVGW